jgi:hypothetical protein
LILSEFQAIEFWNSGGNASDLEIRFAGGNGAFNYGHVVSTTEAGVVTRGGLVAFERLIDAPVYPALSGSIDSLVWILVACVLIGLFTLGMGIFMYKLLVKVKPVSVELSPIQLYDPPMERRREPKREVVVEEAVTDDERVVVVSEPGEECPDSPYEMRAPPL